MEDEMTSRESSVNWGFYLQQMNLSLVKIVQLLEELLAEEKRKNARL